MIEKIDLGAAMSAEMGSFTQVTDAGFVYGELANGAQVKLKKEDLANVMTNIIINKRLLATLNGYALSGEGKTINDVSTPGVWVVAGAQTVGLSGYSGVLINFGGQKSITGQLLITKDCLAFRRDDGSWNKVSFATVG